jgi:hypothetical protein
VIHGKAVPGTDRATFTTWRHYTPDDPLLPSGLLGPVTLSFAEVHALELNQQSESGQLGLNRRTQGP